MNNERKQVSTIGRPLGRSPTLLGAPYQRHVRADPAFSVEGHTRKVELAVAYNLVYYKTNVCAPSCFVCCSASTQELCPRQERLR